MFNGPCNSMIVEMYNKPYVSQPGLENVPFSWGAKKHIYILN